MKILIPLLLLLPCTLQAQIFRCEAKGDTYYSQIPCSESSEAVVIEDSRMFTETPGSTAAPPPEQSAAPLAPERTQADNMQEFISTLRRQRSGQLQQLDSDIGKLEEQLNAIGNTPSETTRRDAVVEQLADLRSSRSSIVEQYESMILEAERRVAALTAVDSSIQDKMD